jgi:poly(3-hydroxybutyrate) depolymerase
MNIKRALGMARAIDMGVPGPLGVLWAPAGNRIYVPLADKTVRVYDPNNGAHVATLTGHTDWVYGVALNPDGATLASASADGTDDEFAAFHGGPGPRSISGTSFYSVEHSIQAWLKANGCPAEPQLTEEPDRADDGMRVIRKTYGPGRDGSEVVLLVVEGGGHTWPGRETPATWLGKVTKDISANDLMWEFFQKHPMK